MLQDFLSSYWVLPTAIATPLLLWDFIFFICFDHGRNCEKYIEDIRAMNQYCSYYFAFITILAGLLISGGKLPQNIGFQQCVPFGIAIFAASVSIVFLPVKYSVQASIWVKIIWLRCLLCQKVVIVFTAYGIFRFVYDVLK